MRCFLRVGDENDAIHAPQNQLAAGVVKNLAGNGVEVNSGLEAAHRTQIQRQEIEEQRTFRLGGQRDHLALLLVRSLLVDHLQIRGLAAESGAVIHDLAIDLSGCEVDETQGFPRKQAFPSGDAERHHVLIWRLAVFISYGQYGPQVTQVTPGARGMFDLQLYRAAPGIE